MIVFGSDYRTANGHVAPQHTTQALLEGGCAADRDRARPATAPSASPRIQTIGLLAGLDDHAAIDTAHRLADALRGRPSLTATTASTC